MNNTTNSKQLGPNMIQYRIQPNPTQSRLLGTNITETQRHELHATLKKGSIRFTPIQSVDIKQDLASRDEKYTESLKYTLFSELLVGNPMQRTVCETCE